jgi:Fe-S oxidoreductase
MRTSADSAANILASGTSLIATDCPGCVFQLKANLTKEGKKFRVFHTAQLFAEAKLKDKFYADIQSNVFHIKREKPKHG